MSGLFPCYTPQKVNNVFTGSSLLEMYLFIIAFCYVCYHLLTGRCEDQCEDIFLPVYGIYHILS